MAYVYRHIRLDTNQVFYIGVGSDGYYKRSRTKFYRNKYWHNIVNSTDYDIEIIVDNITTKEAHIKEMEFIKLYGRKDLNLGTLVNMTDGGEGMLEVSKETREALRTKRLGNKNPFFGKKHSDKLLATIYKPILNLDTGIYYISAKEACKTTNHSYRHFSGMMNGSRNNITNFMQC